MLATVINVILVLFGSAAGLLFKNLISDRLTAALGIGVAFSVVPMLLYQGSITLLAGWVGPYLPEAVITEMTAVGGALIVAIGVNLLGLGKEKIRAGNMLPAMFLPIAYLPLAEWIGSFVP